MAESGAVNISRQVATEGTGQEFFFENVCSTDLFSSSLPDPRGADKKIVKYLFSYFQQEKNG